MGRNREVLLGKEKGVFASTLRHKSEEPRETLWEQENFQCYPFMILPLSLKMSL